MPNILENLLSSESAAVPAHNIIVIHPGSQNLRIGRSSDQSPATILHAIARKRLDGGEKHVDKYLPAVNEDPSVLTELDEARKQVSHTLQSCLQSDGSRRYATPPQQISAFNRRSQPEQLEKLSPDYFASANSVIIGDNVAKLHPNANYSIHFPMKRGELNLHAGVGGSLTAVMHDLESIWSYAIEKVLKIPLKNLPSLRAVLIIPDIYKRRHLRELMTLLLTRLKFGGCFLVQDHVAATFGSGVPSACVVDVGDQKTSISCVDDGLCQPSTRIRLDYGGGDVTMAFFWLLQKCSFPYRLCDPTKMSDALLLQRLKEEFCHVDLNICGPREKMFVVQAAQQKAQKITLQVGDECLIAPLSLFTPDLLSITGPKGVHGQVLYEPQSEDPHDANYLRETSRKGAKELDPAAEGGASANLSSLCSMSLPLDINNMMEEDIVVDALDPTFNASSILSGAANILQEKESFESDILLSIDQAILQSIERCPEELKKKMYSCILIVGGGMKFVGISTWLQNKIALHIPFIYKGDQLEILTSTKETDPQITVWKGASLMATLESASELWIKPQDWIENSVKILREKASFVW